AALDGRAVRRARRAHARASGISASAHVAARAQHGLVRDTQHLRSGAAVRHCSRIRIQTGSDTQDRGGRSSPAARHGHAAPAARQGPGAGAALSRFERRDSERNGKRMARLTVSFRAAVETLGVVAVIVLAWQYGAPWGAVPDYILPLPSVIATTFWRSLPEQ